MHLKKNPKNVNSEIIDEDKKLLQETVKETGNVLMAYSLSRKH